LAQPRFLLAAGHQR